MSREDRADRFIGDGREFGPVNQKSGFAKAMEMLDKIEAKERAEKKRKQQRKKQGK